MVDALRRNLRGKLPVVSDATAAVTALRTKPGLPGGTGTGGTGAGGTETGAEGTTTTPKA